MCVLVHSGDLMTSHVSIPRFSSSTRPASRAFRSSVASRSSAISLSFRLTIGFDDSWTHPRRKARLRCARCGAETCYQWIWIGIDIFQPAGSTPYKLEEGGLDTTEGEARLI